MPKQLTDFQSALIITTLGDGSLVVHIHTANTHQFGPKTLELLERKAKELQDEMRILYHPN